MGKTKKKKGPIRFEAIIPITIVIVLMGLYFTYFFDNHLRKGIEFGATLAHGAEVNVSNLRTSFTEPSITITRIQVTDKKTPAMNMIEIGKIKLKLLWDALLRGKLVIPESSVLDIQLQSKRSKIGRVLPPRKNTGESGIVADGLDKTVDELKEKNESNFLSDIIAVADGNNYKDQLKKMENELKSSARAKVLEKELKAKEKEWKKTIDELPKESEIKRLVKKVESFKVNTKNPKSIQTSIKELDKIYKEARDKYKNIESAKKAFSNDIKKYNNEYKALEKMAQDDINGITNKLNIPSLDPQELSKMLLGNMVADQLKNVEKYKRLAREYIPTKSSKDKTSDELTPTERAKGLNFRFLKTKSYPHFWLQKAQISSKSSQGQSGDLSGTIQNVTDAPKHLGKPATMHFEGGFPHSKILNIVGDLVVDHTTDVAKETATVSVGHFPVTKNTLSKSKDVEFGYNKADGSSKINVALENNSVSLKVDNLFTNVDYFVSAESKKLLPILQGIINGLKELTLNVRAKGSWDDLSLHINSNLGQKLQTAIKAQVQVQINKARKDVENHVKGLVNKEKAKFQGEVNKIEQKYGVSLKNREDAINSVKTQVDKKKKDAIAKEKNKAKKKLENEAKKLLKGLKF